VTINVDGATAATSALIQCYTTAVNSSTITGGRLTLNLNNRVATGIYLRHNAASSAGTVRWGPITVTNAKELGSGVTAENQGLLVYGRYVAVSMDHPIIDGVDRTNTGGGACKGISISEVDGQVTLNQPQVARVLCTGGTADADGIAVFGRTITTSNAKRGGSVQILEPVVTDCQGRSIKLQTTEAEIVRPRFNRQMVVSIANGSDIDSQTGGTCIVRDPVFDYRKNGATSPFGASFTPISFQQNCTDLANHQVCLGGVIRTDAQLERIAFVTVASGSLSGHAEIAGLDVMSVGGLSGTVASRALVEFNAGQVAASSNKTHIVVRDNRGDFTNVPMLGYISFGASVAAKLSFEVSDNTNTGTTEAKTFAAVSGSNIPQVASFLVRDNAATVDLFATWTFDYAALMAGCRFAYDIGSSTATNAPGSLGASGVALVEVLGAINSTGGRRTIRVTRDNGGVANSVFHTQNPAGGWGAIK
jgi:hypothetical protein